MSWHRRKFLQTLAASSASAILPAIPGSALAAGGGKIVVIGGGFGGATAAKYIRLWNPNIEVTLVEPNTAFISCPISNRVIGGTFSIADLTRKYTGLSAHGVKVVHDTVTGIDVEKREVRLAKGRGKLSYDRLIVAPGVDFMYETIPGLTTPEAQKKVLHGWKAGAQTLELREQLHSMKQGGIFAMHIPKAPYRCPPGPYERASLVANYLKNQNPKAKLLVFDANPEIQSKKGLFTGVWESHYKDIIEYVPNADLKQVNASTKEFMLDLQGQQKADVLNIIPPMRAGAIAQKAKLVTVSDRWCGVDFLTYESTVAKNVHVIGDSIATAPGMPKSGHMANQQAKVCAAAVVALLSGDKVNDQPIIANTCYSFVNETEVVHVASVHKYDAAKKTMTPVQGAGGLSPAPNTVEAYMAMGWVYNIMNDMFA